MRPLLWISGPGLAIAPIVVALVAVVAVAPARAQTNYRPTDLTPSGIAQEVGGVSRNQVIGTSRGSRDHAVLMDVSTGAATDLHPSFLADSYGTGIRGDQQVGWGWLPGGVQRRALLWRGTPGSLVQLHPSGFYSSTANDTDGVQQVGVGQWTEVVNSRALLWRGTAASFVDLTPTHLGHTAATATGVANGRQVGFAWNDNDVFTRGMVWSGSAASAVQVLPPAGFTSVRLWGTSGDQHVGVTFTNRSPFLFHAGVWGNEPGSGVDLHPGAAYGSSDARATNGLLQVGHVTLGTGSGQRQHAALWEGSPDSFLDLHALLPVGAFTESVAGDIDAAGNVFGTATDAGGVRHLIVWRPVPEPSAGLIVGALAFASLTRRRRRE